MSEDGAAIAFAFFNEVGIISQLATTLFNRRLPDGLHVAHFGVVNHMVRLGDGRTPLVLARAFQVSKGTMTHTLSGLIERQLVRIEPHPTDARSKLVHLTAAGRRFHARAIASLAPDFAALARMMDPGKLGAVLPVLREVRVALDLNRPAGQDRGNGPASRRG